MSRNALVHHQREPTTDRVHDQIEPLELMSEDELRDDVPGHADVIDQVECLCEFDEAGEQEDHERHTLRSCCGDRSCAEVQEHHHQ